MKRLSIGNLGISAKFVASLLAFLILPLLLLFTFFNARFSTELERRFFSRLVELGVPVSIESIEEKA